MNTRFLLHNIQQQDAVHFTELDVHLCKLKHLPYIYKSPLLYQLTSNVTGIYTLTGGTQTGKTTLLKQWILKFIAEGLPSQAIGFFPGEMIHDYHELIELLKTHLASKQSNKLRCIFIDDVTYISQWEKAIKTAEKAGWFNQTLLVLTSSDKWLNKKIPFALKKEKTNFHLAPLTFKETIQLKNPNKEITELNLFQEFNHYLLHGGYLCAMNDIALHKEILDSTLKTYADSLKKNMLKAGKQEHFLLEILTAIINHYSCPITWNGLSQELSIDHPKTIANYITLLESMDCVFIQSALLKETLKAAPKKARKLMFIDPFIFHAIRAWIRPRKHSFKTDIKPILNKSELCSKLVEACTTTHYQLYYPTYYIKAECEINLAYIYKQRVWPIMITWANQLRAKELKQILKYPNGKILTKEQRSNRIEHIRTEPIPEALWKLEDKAYAD